jgi:streptogramin lyase
MVVLLGPAVGVASAGAAPVLTWSRGGNTITSHEFAHAGSGGRAAPRAFPRANSGTAAVTAASTSGVGRVTIYPGPVGPSGITAGPDGALWSANFGGNSIGQMTTSGKYTNYTSSMIDGPEDIAAGPDGALWFANTNGFSVGRITTAGQVTNTYTGPAGNLGDVGEITPGPDGALWFTNRIEIGKVTTTGQVSEYFSPSINNPGAITAGPDGAMWFTSGTHSIGRITTAGQLTNTYTAPGINEPNEITAGPDGALWFTNFNGNSIGRITTAGKVTIFTAPGIAGPEGIAAGPDGALWFTSRGNNSIGRITTAGKVTIFTAPGIAGPDGITAGRDGAMWFTNGLSHSIGRITTGMIGNPDFAGYQTAVSAGSATSSAATFTVPALACTTAARTITPVAGVEANRYKTFSSAFMFTGCVSGKAAYFPALVVNGTETNYPSTPFSAGDVINLSTSVTTAGTTVQVEDVTTGVAEKLTGRGASASAAYIGDSSWFTSAGKRLGVPNFGTLAFTNCLIDGTALASRHPNEYLRVNKAAVVQIAPGALSSTGTAFTTYYKHS